MCIKRYYIILCLLPVSLFSKVKSQADTIYVYEEVVVYDTVVSYDTHVVKPRVNPIKHIQPKTISLLQLDTITKSANLLLISDQQTATISINHIILDENINKNLKDSESMKKLNFFGVVLFAFQTMVLAQTDFEISLGGGIWWENGNPKTVDIPCSPMTQVGFYLKRNLTNSNVGLKTGLKYGYLFSQHEYKNHYKYRFYYKEYHYRTGEPEFVGQFVEFEDLNLRYGSDFHHLSIPLLFYYNKYKLKPVVGLNYNYMATGFQENTYNTKHFTQSQNVGINAGINYNIFKNISLYLEYTHNLFYDYGEWFQYESNGNTVIDVGRYLWHNQASISVVYEFNKKQE